MRKENNQFDDIFRWKVVDREEVAKATKVRNEKIEKSNAAMEALTKLKLGEAICIAFPEGKGDGYRRGYEASCASADLRGWWGTKMRSVSKKEGTARAFLTTTSSDGKFLFVQRRISKPS